MAPKNIVMQCYNDYASAKLNTSEFVYVSRATVFDSLFYISRTTRDVASAVRSGGFGDAARITLCSLVALELGGSQLNLRPS